MSAPRPRIVIQRQQWGEWGVFVPYGEVPPSKVYDGYEAGMSAEDVAYLPISDHYDWTYWSTFEEARLFVVRLLDEGVLA